MPPKVMFVIPAMTGTGAPRVTAALLGNLDPLRFEAVLVTFYEAGDSHVDLPPGLKTVVLHRAGPRRFLRLCLDMVRAIRAERPALILSVGNHANCVVSVAAWLARTGAKLVLAEHSAMRVDPKEAGGRRVRKRLARWLYPRAHAVLAVSDGLRKEMIDLLALRPEMCRTIYNPVEIGRIRTLAREPVEAFVADSGLPVVVTCGRLILLKNHRLLLKAFRDVQARQPSRLVILGEGPERPALEALAQELGIAEHVSFLGFQANPFKFMARAVVFALSSDTEAFPCVIQEAMACGVPVISADCDYGPREIITDGRNGLLVPPGDQAALTAAIVRVLPDAELRARLAAEASRTVLRYDAPAVTRQYESLFDEVLAKSGRGGGA